MPSMSRHSIPPLLLEWPCSALRNREQSIGVMVKLMNRLIRIEKPTTSPKLPTPVLLRTRPTTAFASAL